MTPTTTATAPPAARVPLAGRVAERQNWATPADPDTTRRVGEELLGAVLAELAELGVRVPAGVGRALALDRATAAVLTRPPGIAEWMAGQDLDALTAEQIAARIREDVVSLEVGGSTGRLAQEVGAFLTEQAIDALADGLDDVIDQIRPSWDDAAGVIAAAVRAGIHSATTADQAIADDTLVEHWRALTPAVATLDRLDRVHYRCLFVGGFPLTVREQARSGRAAWLDACAAGPVQLLAPSARPEPEPEDRPGVGSGTQRGAVALELQREHLTAMKEQRDAAEEQRLASVRRLAEQREADAASGAGARGDDEVYATVGGVA